MNQDFLQDLHYGATAVLEMTALTRTLAILTT
jgi:hypothetical protein